MLVTRGGATLFMSRGDDIVLSMSAAGTHERVEVARIDDSLHMPHLVAVEDDAYFLSDTRRLYRLDAERFTVKKGHRIDADKVLPLVGLEGVAYAAYVVDGPNGYETKIARLDDEWSLTERTTIRGELVRMWARDGRLRAAGARGVGRSFDMVWEPTVGLAAITDRPSLYGRHALPSSDAPVDREPSTPFEGTSLHDGMIRPEPPTELTTYEGMRAELGQALTELSHTIDRALPPQYERLYELAFSDYATRERLQRIGLFLVHPMQRTRAQMSRGLLPLAEATDDSLVCLDVSDELLMPVVKLYRDDTMREVGLSFGLFFEAHLSGASSLWPTTVRELRRTLEG